MKQSYLFRQQNPNYKQNFLQSGLALACGIT